MSAATNSVLYFPSIEFADDAWVKAALVVWDHVYRVVPPGYSPKDSDEIKQAVDAGVVRNLAVDKHELDDAMKEYDGLVQSLPYLPHGLAFDPDLHLLHPGKIDERLYPKLAVQASHVFSDGRLQLPKGLARGYLFSLAQSVAKRRNLCRGTDDRDCWTVASYFAEHGNFTEGCYIDDAEMYYSSLAIEEIIPTRVRSVPMKAVLDFAASKASEKEALRSSLHSLTQEIAAVESLEHRRQVLADYTKSVERKAKALRKATSDFCSLDDLRSLFVVGLPATTSALWSFGLPNGGDPYQLLRLATNMFIVAVAVYADTKLVARRNRHPSVETYLIDLDERMAKERRFPAFHHALDEFIND